MTNSKEPQISPEALNLAFSLTKAIALELEYSKLTRRLAARLNELEPDHDRLLDPAVIDAAMRETNAFLERLEL